MTKGTIKRCESLRDEFIYLKGKRLKSKEIFIILGRRHKKKANTIRQMVYRTGNYRD